MNGICIKDLTYHYRDQVGSFLALDDVSLDIADGEFACVIGHSGCGKSTLLMLLAGLAKPDSGSIEIDGKPIDSPSVDRAMVFQHYSLFPWMTVLKNVEFTIRQSRKVRGESISKEEVARFAREILADVGMLDYIDMYPFQLSGGMQQRVAIARSLAMESRVLLLDEPFGALDAKNRSDLQRLLIRLWEESTPRKTIVFVTHDLNEAILLSTKIVAMSPKRVEKVIDLDFPRPRSMESLSGNPSFLQTRDDLMAILSNDSSINESLQQSRLAQNDDVEGILHYADIQGGE